MVTQDRFLNLQPGFLIANRYEVIKCLGAGSMGMVYACSYKELSDHIVALKVLFGEVSEDPVLAARFKNEIYASYGISHPNVVKAYEYIEEDGLIAFSMEFIDGGDLANRLAESEPLSFPEIFRMLAQMSSGLVAIHEAGLIHRDLKPENILLTREGNVKIADFGIVRNVAGPRLTEHGGVIGTIEYVSPEYLGNNQIDERSDLFSFGVLAYEMVTQESPFRGETLIETMQKKLKQDPISPLIYRPECPEKLSQIILKSLEKDPKKRYQKAKAVLDDLMNLASELEIKLELDFSKEEPSFKEEAAKKSKKSEFRKFFENVTEKTRSGTIQVVKSLTGDVDISQNRMLFEKFKELKEEKNLFSIKSLILWILVLFVWMGLGFSLLNHYKPELFNSNGEELRNLIKNLKQ